MQQLLVAALLSLAHDKMAQPSLEPCLVLIYRHRELLSLSLYFRSLKETIKCRGKQGSGNANGPGDAVLSQLLFDYCTLAKGFKATFQVVHRFIKMDSNNRFHHSEHCAFLQHKIGSVVLKISQFLYSTSRPILSTLLYPGILRAVPEIILGGHIFFQTPPPPGHTRSQSPPTPRTRKCLN